MGNATLWRALLGVERTVIEDVELEEDEQVLIAHVRPPEEGRPEVVWALPTAGAVVWATARAAGGGAAWTWGWCECGWRPTRRG